MFETVVVPLDGSELAEAALAPALAIRERFGSKLVLVRVLEPESHRLVQAPALFESPAAAAASVSMIEQIMEAERQEARSYLGAVKEKLGDGDAIEALIVEGAAGQSIIDLARQQQGPLIVMSSHGRGGLGRLVYGSVADSVLRESNVPVLLVRNSAIEAPAG